MSNRLLDAHRRSLSDKARYNFDSDMSRWSAWRGAKDSLIVAAPYEVRNFVLHCATTGFGRGPLKPASIAHILSSLARFHVRVLEAPDPTKDVIVKGEVKRLRREFGNAQDKAIALRANDDVPLPASSPPHHLRIPVPSIVKLRAACDVATPRGLRERVILGLGKDLGRHSRDLHLFDIADILPRPDGRGTVIIRQSKTDQLGEGTTKIISNETMLDVAAWVSWRTGNGSNVDDALLISIERSNRPGSRLCPWGINYSIRRIVVATVLVSHPSLSSDDAWTIAKQVSSHGFRIGLAQDGVCNNEDAYSICDRGDWKDGRRPLSYAHNLDAPHGAVARLRSLIPLR